MAYTPELSDQSSCTLRRIAWALGVPMTKAIERVFEHMPAILDKYKVCRGVGIKPDVETALSTTAETCPLETISR